MNGLIFLDMDGPMNSHDNMNAMTMAYRVWCENRGLNMADKNPEMTPYLYDYGKYCNYKFDPRCVSWLWYILESTHADIVISSTWRYIGLGAFQKFWEGRNMPGKLVGITPYGGYKITDETYGTEYHTTERGWEIQQFLHDLANKSIKESFCVPEIYDKQYESYIIIDDDKDMLPHQMPQFVQVNTRFGLDYRTAKLSVELLNNKVL